MLRYAKDTFPKKRTDAVNLRSSSTLLMLGSASIWALIPLFFALGAESGNNPFLFTAVFNAMGALLSAVLYYAIASRRQDFSHARAFVVYVSTSTGLRAVALDGGGIALSNAAFVYALSFNNDAVVTLIVESWPLLAAFLLTIFIRRFQQLTGKQIVWSSVAVIGFYFLVASRGEPIFQDLAAFALLAACAAAFFQAMAVAFNQRTLQELSPDVALQKNLLVQSARMGIASVLSAAVAFTFPGSGLDSAAWGTAACLAIAILASALLYAMSLQLTASAVTTLIWFVTPVISIFLLATVGLADLTSNLLVGATLVISANVFLQERLESTTNVAALVAPTVAIGTLILYVPGIAVANYFEYVQIIAAFYGILQGFLLSRLWDRRTRIGVLEEVWILTGRGHELSEERVEFDPLEGAVAKDVAELNVLRQEVRSYSEAILLTVLGLAAGTVVVAGRDNSFIANVLAFLIPVAIAYLLAISWSLIRSGSYRELAIVSSAGVADAIISYALVVLIFCVMLFAIGLGGN